MCALHACTTISYMVPAVHVPYGLMSQELNRFPFEVIVKWLPSHLRSRNPGTPDCLDLQIMTDKGPRDLRMRCGSEDTVQFVMDSIHCIVQVSTAEHVCSMPWCEHIHADCALPFMFVLNRS